MKNAHGYIHAYTPTDRQTDTRTDFAPTIQAQTAAISQRSKTVCLTGLGLGPGTSLNNCG